MDSQLVGVTHGPREGQVDVADLQYQWKATLVSQGKQYGNSNEGMGTGLSKNVGLYNIEVQGASASAYFEFRLVRWNDNAV